MITFKDNKDNNEYIIMNIHIDGGVLVASDILPVLVANEIEKMYLSLPSFEQEIGKYISEVSFRKDSLLGEWLLNNYNQKKIIYDSKYISVPKIEQAMAISMLECNRIIDKIIPLLNAKVTGDIGELMDVYDKDALNYILEHDNYEEYIYQSNSGRYIQKEVDNKEYIVYENGKYSKKELSTEKKVLEKIDENKPV